jgi:hypothetical protein
MKLNNLLILIGIILSLNHSNAQSVKEVAAKYAEALGGKENILKVSSFYIECTIQTNEQIVESKTIILYSKGSKTVSEIRGLKYLTCFTEKTGWRIDPMSGSNEPINIPENEFKTMKPHLVFDVLATWPENGYKAELVVKGKADSVKTIEIKMLSPDNMVTIFNLDPITYYPVTITLPKDPPRNYKELTSKLSDFRKTDAGIVFAFTTTTYDGQYNSTLKAKLVEFNKIVDPSIFEKGNLNLY